jgi:hypothetical protein
MGELVFLLGVEDYFSQVERVVAGKPSSLKL